MERDVLAGLSALRQRAEVMLAQAQAAQSAVGGPLSGRDDRGAVSVTVDGDGTVIDLAVAPDWQNLVGIGGLGTAIESAVAAVTAARLEAWAAAFTADNLVPPQAPPPEPPSASHRGSMTELVDLLHGINADVDRLTQEITATMAGAHTGRSRAGHAAVTVTRARALVEVSLDKRWLVRAHVRAIGKEIIEAFDAAYQRVGRPDPAGALARTRLGEVLGPDAGRPRHSYPSTVREV
jgi:DNA-binding protein YbaB